MMMNKQIGVALLLTIALFPLNADAGEGFFAGASIGSASLSEDFDGLKVDDDSTAFRIVGGWRANPYFALEIGYHNFGDFRQTIDAAGAANTIKLSADGFTFGVTGSVPVSDRFSLLGRAGVFFWDGNAKVNNVSQATPEDTNPFFGAGVGFAINKSFQLTGDWTRYELEDVNSDVYSLGLVYRFGK